MFTEMTQKRKLRATVSVAGLMVMYISNSDALHQQRMNKINLQGRLSRYVLRKKSIVV